MERLIGVNFVVVAWSVSIRLTFPPFYAFCSAVSIPVTIVVEANIAGLVARMRSCGPSHLVGLHKVEFWTIIAIYFVAVTVTPAICVHVIWTVWFSSGHSNKIEGGDAATIVLTQVDIPLDGATKKIYTVVVGIVAIESLRFCYISSTLTDLVAVRITGCEGTSHVLFLFATIFLNINGRKLFGTLNTPARLAIVVKWSVRVLRKAVDVWREVFKVWIEAVGVLMLGKVGQLVVNLVKNDVRVGLGDDEWRDKFLHSLYRLINYYNFS